MNEVFCGQPWGWNLARGGLEREQRRLGRRDFPGGVWLAYWEKEDLYSFMPQETGCPRLGETGTTLDVPEPLKGFEGLRTQASLNWEVATGMEAWCLRQPKLRVSDPLQPSLCHRGSHPR